MQYKLRIVHSSKTSPSADNHKNNMKILVNYLSWLDYAYQLKFSTFRACLPDLVQSQYYLDKSRRSMQSMQRAGTHKRIHAVITNGGSERACTRCVSRVMCACVFARCIEPTFCTSAPVYSVALVC